MIEVKTLTVANDNKESEILMQANFGWELNSIDEIGLTSSNILYPDAIPPVIPENKYVMLVFKRDTLGKNYLHLSMHEKRYYAVIDTKPIQKKSITAYLILLAGGAGITTSGIIATLGLLIFIGSTIILISIILLLYFLSENNEIKDKNISIGHKNEDNERTRSEIITSSRSYL